MTLSEMFQSLMQGRPSATTGPDNPRSLFGGMGGLGSSQLPNMGAMMGAQMPMDNQMDNYQYTPEELEMMQTSGRLPLMRGDAPQQNMFNGALGGLQPTNPGVEASYPGYIGNSMRDMYNAILNGSRPSGRY